MAAFYNQASLTYAGGTVFSNVATGEIIDTLTASKTAVDPFYTSGDGLTYVINIVNSGNTPVNGLTVTDDLGAYEYGGQTLVPLEYNENSLKYFADGVLQATQTVTSADTLTVSGINVPANGSAALVYTARVTEYADPGQSGVITNTAVITGYASPLTVTAAVNAGSGAELEMQKSVSPSAVPANGQLTYTFTILNHGTAEAAATENIVLNDTFDPLLSGLSVTFNGNEWTSPENYAYDETTGVFSTVAGNITVPAATYVRDPATGAWTAVPGTAVLTVSGNI